MKVVFDTTMLIHLLRMDPKAIEVSEQLLKQSAVLYTTTINLYEVRKGIKFKVTNQEKVFNALETLKNSLVIIPLDDEAADAAADLYVGLRKKGITIDETDYLIAGVCLSNGIHSIVTKNEKHFKHIAGLEVIGH